MSETDRHSSVSDDGPAAGDNGSADDPSRRSQAEARRHAGAAAEHYRVRRFDADRTDEGLSFEEAIASKPSGRQLLWIDIAGELAWPTPSRQPRHGCSFAMLQPTSTPNRADQPRE